MNALIIGGAACVWEDVRALEAEFGRWDGLVIAVNDVGVHWPRQIDHWVSLHAEKFRSDRQHPRKLGWLEQRRANGHPDGYITWGRKGNPNRTVSRWHGGASGLFALAVAREVGATRVVLCGVPMDTRPHFAESRVHVAGRKWNSANAHWRAWTQHMAELRGWVRSMSGRTRQTFGAPTAAWLAGDREEAA